MPDLTTTPISNGPTPPTVHLLGALDTLEVSLVSRGANGRAFALRKSVPAKVTTMPTISAVTEKAKKAEPMPGGWAFVMPERNADESDFDYAKRIAGALDAAPGEASSEEPVVAADPATAPASPNAALCDPIADPIADPAMKATPDMCDAHVPTTEQERAIATKSEVTKAAAAMPEGVRKAYLDAIAKADKLEAEVKKATREAARKSFIAKGAALSHVGKADDLGVLLHDLAEANPEFAKRVEAVLSKTNALLAKSSLFVEVGKSTAETDTSAEPIDRLNALAKAHSEKEKISFAKAFAHIIKTSEGRKLYAEQDAAR